MTRVVFLSLVVLASAACGSSDELPPPDDEPPPTAVPCAAWETPTEEGCLPPGVPPDGCAEGFVHDGGVVCAPVLPAEPCPPGSMAVPGDEACREVMACGDGPWGELPSTGAVVFVDPAAGAGGDGTMTAPLTTVSAALAIVPPGGTVALAAGTYAETLLVDAPVRLQGRCPSLVELRNAPGENVAVRFGPGASGSQLIGVAVTADNGFSVVSFGGADILLDRIWVHDQPLARGPLVQPQSNAPASMTIVDSLVEGTLAAAALASGGLLRIERSELRDPVYAPSSGYAAVVLGTPMDGVGATVEIVGSRLTRGDGSSVLIIDSSASVQGSVVEQNQLALASFGSAMEVSTMGSTADRARLDLVQSVLRDNVSAGINLAGADALIDRTAILRTLPRPTGRLGRSVSLQGNLGAPATATLLDSTLASSFDVSLFAAGSNLAAERLAIMDTAARPSDLTGGRGVSVQPLDGVPSVFELRQSRVERSQDQGVAIIGSNATIENTAVLDTAPRPSDAAYGDGVAVVHEAESPGGASLAGLLIQRSAGAGLAVFGTEASLFATLLDCNAVQIHGGKRNGLDFNLDNLGDNVCGCGETTEDCKVLSTDIEPPGPL